MGCQSLFCDEMVDILRIVVHIEPAGERLFSCHAGVVVILSLALVRFGVLRG
jgi:hypothetical protein